jgi:hypothetical protein
VEPSIFNPADSNSDTNFAFCEFTFNSWELFINISYVDFVSALPVALTVKDGSGKESHVSGMKPNGLDQIAQGLKDQSTKDGRRWGSLVVKSKAGQNLRALSPNSGILLNPSWFKTYWDDYINQGRQTFTGPLNPQLTRITIANALQSGPATPPNPSQSTRKPPTATSPAK